MEITKKLGNAEQQTNTKKINNSTLTNQEYFRKFLLDYCFEKTCKRPSIHKLESNLKALNKMLPRLLDSQERCFVESLIDTNTAILAAERAQEELK